jgi:hypothetical protein
MYSEILCRSHVDYVSVPSEVQLSSAIGAGSNDHAYFISITRSLDSGEILLDENSFEEDVNYSRVGRLQYCWHGLEEQEHTLHGDED